MHDIHVPKFGMSATEAEILTIFVAVGDHVEAGQAVIEAESDKAVFEIEADVAGVVTEILATVDDVCPMGSVVMRIEP